jgi:hypothetical protein
MNITNNVTSLQTIKFLIKTQFMKKITMILASGILLAATAQAQTTDKTRTTYSIRAGVNFQNLNGEDANGEKYDYKMATKWHIGVEADVPVGTDFYFRPGLIFNNKGAKQSETIMGEKLEMKANISYIDIPLSFVYKPQVGNGRAILGFGPYAGFGISGKVKSSMAGQEEEMDIEFKNDVKSSDPAAFYLKRLDAGANIFAGYEFTQNIFVQLNAQLGLMNIEPKADGEKPEDKTKHTGFGVSIGYRF